jgi:tRNA 2-thiouridine synthesizing protein A
MERTLDVRGLACPIPALRARIALRSVPPGGTLVVLATDPEAPIDLAALAADEACAFAERRDALGWRFELRRAG